MRGDRLHVMLGTKEDYVAPLANALTQSGYENPVVVKRALKISVLQYLEENKDVDVLIVQEGLEEARPFQVSEYARFLDLIDRLVIIPILSDESMQNKQFLLELYNHHILTAVFGSATIMDIVQLIKNGRTRVSARQYYGLAGTAKDGAEEVDYESSVQYIVHGGGALKDRLDYIKKRVHAADLKIILKKLPQDIVKEAHETEGYASLMEECFPELASGGKQGNGGFRRPHLKNWGQDGAGQEREDTGSFGAPFASHVLVDYLTAIKKVVLGFVGVQEHIGATFNAIAFAHYLAGKNYRVSVIEDGSQKNLSMGTLEKDGGAVRTKFGFSCKGVDYYPKFALCDLPRILQVQDYNFVLIDFGIFREEMLPEFNRCTVPVLVTGSKTWEMPSLDHVFECFVLDREKGLMDEEMLAGYYYLFTAAAPAAQRSIRDNMCHMKNVYFADFLLNPLSGKGFPAMEEMVGSYLPVAVPAQGKGESVFGKLKKLFD